MSVAAVLSGERRFHVEQGDALDVLRAMPSDSVDAIVCDPPAGISFMGKAWDSDKGGAMRWIRWLARVMREARRVLKPGGHALVWALPRTSHWTGMALQLAGFEIRDRVSHLFGSGFPKSLDVSKAVDKLAGAEREIVGSYHVSREFKGRELVGDESHSTTVDITKPATAAAAALQGWGTALKPACEDWWLCRKPFRGSVVRNVLENGTGAINVDGCRVPHANAADLEAHAAGVAAIKERGGVMDNSWKNSSDLSGAADVTPLGRWPAHVLLSHAPGCERVGVRKVKASTPWGKNDRPPLFTTGEYVSPISYGDGDGFETVEHWRCVEGCPVAELDAQSGESASAKVSAPPWGRNEARGWGMKDGGDVQAYADTGGASRYFTTFAPFLYTPKADRTEREKGCEYLPKKTGGELTGREDGTAGLDSPRSGAGRRGGRRNHHPTVKPTDLMRWLVRLITPPGGVVLDMFAGSGSTGVACSVEGFRFIGIELDPAYAEIARARILGDAPLLNAGAF